MNPVMVLQTVVVMVSRLTVAAIFGVSASKKLGQVSAFENSVQGYGLLPYRWVGPLSRLLPWVELGTAVCLCGPPALSEPAAVLAFALLVVFSFAIGWSIVQGRSGIPCGCGLSDRQPISHLLLVRNLGLGLMSLQATQPLSTSPTWQTYLITFVGVLAALGLIGSADQLMANQAHREGTKA